MEHCQVPTILDALLHPVKAFVHPMDVVRDPDMTLNADSDEVARVKRDEAARDSWMMAPAVTE
jgi:hypothetical protein